LVALAPKASAGEGQELARPTLGNRFCFLAHRSALPDAAEPGKLTERVNASNRLAYILAGWRRPVRGTETVPFPRIVIREPSLFEQRRLRHPGEPPRLRPGLRRREGGQRHHPRLSGIFSGEGGDDGPTSTSSARAVRPAPTTFYCFSCCSWYYRFFFVWLRRPLRRRPLVDRCGYVTDSWRGVRNLRPQATLPLPRRLRGRPGLRPDASSLGQRLATARRLRNYGEQRRREGSTKQTTLKGRLARPVRTPTTRPARRRVPINHQSEHPQSPAVPLRPHAAPPDLAPTPHTSPLLSR